MKSYAVDFETYYTKEYSITTLGVDAYIEDPRFDAYLVAVKGEDLEWVGHPRDFDWSQLTGCRCLAHNARFDETVFLKLQRSGIIKNCKPAEWLCTSDLSVYLQAPRSLAGAARALLDFKMDKSTRDMLAKKTYAEACEDGQKELVDEYALDDARACYKIFVQYGDKWSPLERFISKLNREESRRGVAVDCEQLDSDLKHLEHIRWEAGNKIPWDWEEGKTPLSPKKLRLQCRKASIPCPTSLAKDSKACQDWEDKYGQEYPWVGAMRDWRRSNIQLKKLRTLRARTRDGIFPNTIKYFGAHTGRFSGAGGFNLQNMPRGENMGVDLRALFVPRPGFRMVIADLSQIEARITLWLAGDYRTLKQIEEDGISVYEAHAAKTMGYDLSRGRLEDVDPDKYKLAKARVLGLGFGCGAARFRELARTMLGLELSAAESKETVDDFRATNPKIVRLWQILQRDCTWHVGSDYTIELPSGRCLRYFNVKRDRDGLTAEVELGGRRKIHVYGGKLAENLVQATARDVFVYRMPALVELGGNQLFHAHDEYVLEVPDKGASVQDIEAAIAVTPDWLEGCPIGVKVKEVDRYLK